ncbi:MAG: hypothetical protein BWY55_00378 [archaeon ADurb.Bin336]|nr:MAG: hypothetical protein BWY55_00378 [archaeon ADurb.Bin336]
MISFKDNSIEGIIPLAPSSMKKITASELKQFISRSIKKSIFLSRAIFNEPKLVQNNLFFELSFSSSSFNSLLLIMFCGLTISSNSLLLLI